MFSDAVKDFFNIIKVVSMAVKHFDQLNTKCRPLVGIQLKSIWAKNKDCAFNAILTVMFILSIMRCT